MKRFLRIAALALILCCLGACIAVGWSTWWQFSQPERIVEAIVVSQAGQVERLEIVNKRAWNNKLVVIFTFQRHAEDNRLVECLGYAMLERADQDLRIARSHINPCDDPPTQITFASELLESGLFIYGRAYASDIRMG
jgi:hypothetical protein